MKRYIYFSLVSAIFLLALSSNIASAQNKTHAIKITSPFPNEEYCNATSLPISGTFKNPDSVTRTLIVSFAIRNIVTHVAGYGRSITLQDVPGGTSVDTTFPPYVTNPYILSEFGTFLVCAIVNALDSKGNPIHNWPFADTTCVRIFGIRTTALPFNEPSDGYSKSLSGDIPDQTKWVSLGATIVDGDSETWDPPPPRYMPESGGVGVDELLAPVIRLDRRDPEGNFYEGIGVGDTLTTFPFNILGQTKIGLSFDFMRGGKHLYPDLWDEETLPGPEQTVLDGSGKVIRSGDSLILEFKDTSESACNPQVWNRIVGIDGGKDFEFQSFSILISGATPLASGTYRLAGKQPQKISLGQNYFTNSFRFRLKLKASNNSVGSVPSDDDDAWYIDNVSLQVPRLPEIEVRWGRVVTPYSKIPYSALASVPVYYSVKNNETDVAIGFPMKIFIINSNGDTVYSQLQIVNSLRAGVDSVIRAPDWNAQHIDFTKSPFLVVTRLGSSSYDDYTQDNETFSQFYLNCDASPNAIQEFAYDDGGNDIPQITKVTGAGIGFDATSGSYAMKFTLPQADTVFGARVYFASGSLSSDDIRVTLFKGDSGSCIPGKTILAVTTAKRVGNAFDQFQPYRFSRPITLPGGTYWLSVSQLSPNNFTMGGDLSRGGGVITIADSVVPQIAPVYSSQYGTQWSPTQNSGDVSCAFAVETPAGSGQWQQWMPSSGLWPTNASGNTHQDISWNPMLTSPFFKGGSFLPMIRAMVGSNQFSGVHVSNEPQQEFKLDIESNQIIVSIPDGSSGEARIVDLLGGIIEEKSIASNGVAIFSVQGLPRILFVEVRSQNQFKVFKVLH